MNKCIHCGSTDIKKDITVISKSHLGEVGLKVKSFLKVDCEGLQASLCKNCGNVQLFVKNIDREWD